MLKEHELERRRPIWRWKHGISEATFYNWKAKYGGMEVSEARRLKALEDENAKLKKLLAEQMLDAAALREAHHTTEQQKASWRYYRGVRSTGNERLTTTIWTRQKADSFRRSRAIASYGMFHPKSLK